MQPEVVAVEGDTGVARVEVCYGDPVSQRYRDLWVVRFNAAGRCVTSEEWPFWPKGMPGGWHEGPKPAGHDPAVTLTVDRTTPPEPTSPTLDPLR